MTLPDKYKPFHNRLITLKAKSGTSATGVFLDCLPKEEKLFPEDVMLILEGDYNEFKKMSETAIVHSKTSDFNVGPAKSGIWKAALKTYATRIDLNDFTDMQFVDELKYNLIAKWKDILLNDKKFLAYLKLEEINFHPTYRQIPPEYGNMIVAKGILKGDTVVKYKISNYTHTEYLTENEFEELFELFEKQRLFA